MERLAPLKLIYSTGLIAVYGIFALLYMHAVSKREELELSELEIYATGSTVNENLLMIGIGVVAPVLAMVNAPRLPGMTFAESMTPLIATGHTARA